MSHITRDIRIPTGVPGLDYVLLGGFVAEGFYLVQGDPGSGKTTVALQFVLNRIKWASRVFTSHSPSRVGIWRTPAIPTAGRSKGSRSAT